MSTLTTNNTDWLKTNAKIFLDQNITMVCGDIKTPLKAKGYRVTDVYSTGYKGANDGKLLAVLKANKLILVTQDYHFYKMAIKYNKLAVFIDSLPGNHFRGLGVTGKVIDYLNSNFKAIQEFYNAS